MKILWFTNNSANYKPQKSAYNGGGWISALQKELQNISNIELGIAFHMDNEPTKTKDKNITYYPMSNPPLKTYQKNFIWLFKGENELIKKLEDIYLNTYLSVIRDYNPDIIHIFGSERYYTIISDIVNVPIILHIQGFINPILNAFYPNGISEHNYIWLDNNPLNILKRKRNLLNFQNSAKRELKTLKNIKYFMGRTEWDYRLSKIYNPNSKYYHCDEILRTDFYHTTNRKKIANKIVSTISSPLYKGEDLIIKTAKLLKEKTISNFEWHIFGVNKNSNIHKLLNINTSEYNIIYRGIIDSTTLTKELQDCAIYVQPSYIDNSPNSLCEAQIMGIPTIATYVGGIPTLIENNVTGYLVPANDPYQTAYIINLLLTDEKLRNNIGQKAKETALARHNPQKITNQLINIYKELLQ